MKWTRMWEEAVRQRAVLDAMRVAYARRELADFTLKSWEGRQTTNAPNSLNLLLLPPPHCLILRKKNLSSFILCSQLFSVLFYPRFSFTLWSLSYSVRFHTLYASIICYFSYPVLFHALSSFILFFSLPFSSSLWFFVFVPSLFSFVLCSFLFLIHFTFLFSFPLYSLLFSVLWLSVSFRFPGLHFVSFHFLFFFISVLLRFLFSFILSSNSFSVFL